MRWGSLTLLLSYFPWGSSWARFTQQMFSALCPGVWLCSTTARPEADGSSSGSCLLGAAGTSGFLGELQDRGGGIGRVALVVFPGKGRKALLAAWGEPSWDLCCWQGLRALRGSRAPRCAWDAFPKVPVRFSSLSLARSRCCHPVSPPAHAVLAPCGVGALQGFVPGAPGAGRAPRSAAVALALPQPRRPRAPRRKESTAARPPAQPHSSCRVLLEPPRAGSTSG